VISHGGYNLNKPRISLSLVAYLSKGKRGMTKSRVLTVDKDSASCSVLEQGRDPCLSLRRESPVERVEGACLERSPVGRARAIPQGQPRHEHAFPCGGATVLAGFATATLTSSGQPGHTG
jgi:hypothetical protein